MLTICNHKIDSLIMTILENVFTIFLVALLWCWLCEYFRLGAWYCIIFAFNLVLPKVREIKVEPSYNLIETNSDFTIQCIVTANLSSNVEFLFRPRQSNETFSLRKIQSKFSKHFEWTASISRKFSRESSGDYYCRDTNDPQNEANISINIACMRSNCYLS